MMISEDQVEGLIDLENAAYRAYLEAHLKATSARKQWTKQRLASRKIKIGKTHVFVTNANGDDTRSIVKSITKEGKVVCFPVDVNGRQIGGKQSACCFVKYLRLEPAK